MKQKTKRTLALLLAFTLLLPSCGGSSAKATTMHLKRTEGTVNVSDDAGKDVETREDLGLYSGYGVETKRKAHAWIDLDEVKLTKMDEKSEIAIKKEDKQLEIEVLSGSLFFNVTEPLADDETMTIRSSTMAVGIRGTCGWVSLSEDEKTLSIYLLEGKVECSNRKETAIVSAGEMAEITKKGEIEVVPFTAQDIPGFVMEEIEDDSDLLDNAFLDDTPDDSGANAPNPAEFDPMADVVEHYRTIISQASSYFPASGYFSYDTASAKSYRYTLVQMQTEHSIPALVLEQETNSNLYGWAATAQIFQYDPDSQTSIHVEGGEPTEIVSSAGGLRGGLGVSEDGVGIVESSWQSGTGNGKVLRYTIVGNLLQSDTLLNGFLFNESTQITALPIDWHPITDLSGLESLAPLPSQPSSPAEPEPEPEPEPANPAALPTDGDRIVFWGTLKSYTYQELVAIEGFDPNPGTTGNTLLIVPDTPMTVTAFYPEGTPTTSEVWAFKVNTSTVTGINQYEGQHLIFSIAPNKIIASTDTSLPGGQPWANDVHVLG